MNNTVELGEHKVTPATMNNPKLKADGLSGEQSVLTMTLPGTQMLPSQVSLKDEPEQEQNNEH